MVFSTKRSVRIFKSILVSTYSEVVLLCIRIFTLSLLVFGFSIVDIDGQFLNVNAIRSRYQVINAKTSSYFSGLNHSEIQDTSKLIFGLTDSFWDYFVEEQSGERLMGGIRLIQYRVDKPDYCLSDLSTPDALKNKTRYLLSYTAACNPYDADTLKQIQSNSFKPANKTLCVKPNCSEFKLQSLYKEKSGGIVDTNPTNVIWNPRFGYYPINAFIAEINCHNRTDYNSQLRKLKQNKWLDSKTFAVVFQVNLYNQNAASLNSVTITFQLGDTQPPYSYINLYILNTVSAYSTYWLVFAIILLFADVLFFLKVVFEGSVYYKTTQVPQIINILIELVFTSLCLIEQSNFLSILAAEVNETADCKAQMPLESLYSSPTEFFLSITPCHQFIILDGLIDLNKLRLTFEGLSVMFLPFNVFWLLTYSRLFEECIKFANMIYRTIHNFLKLLLFVMIIVLCWSCGFYKIFSGNFNGFSSYGLSLYSFFLWSVPSTNDPLWYDQAQHTDVHVVAFQLGILIVCRLTLILSLLILTISTIRISSDFLFDFRSEKQKQNLLILNEMQKKMDKFSKSYLQESQEGKQESNKLIAWLNKDLFSEADMILLDKEFRQMDIKLQCFGNIGDLIQFLQFLFQIKPLLLFKSSIHFRIVVDLEVVEGLQSEYLQNEHKQQEYHNVARLLFMLKDKGSRVPMLLNFTPSYRPSDAIIITYFKLYPFLFMNQQNFGDLKDFMLNPNFKSFQQQRMFVKDEEPVEDGELEGSDEEDMDQDA